MPEYRLNCLDPFMRKHHEYLVDDDMPCYYIGEYIGGHGRESYKHGDWNSIIGNLKKKPSKKDTAPKEYKYKGEAIEKISSILAPILGRSSKNYTIVPVPSSKARDNKDYDTRLFDVLRRCKKIWEKQGLHQHNIRELVVNTESHEASHISDNHHTIEELCNWYKVVEEKTEPVPERILIFDDVLTRGTHYKAMQRVLLNYYESQFGGYTPQCNGLFLARTVSKKREDNT